jgi:predicted MFS family arabinose efflux permease
MGAQAHGPLPKNNQPTFIHSLMHPGTSAKFNWLLILMLFLMYTSTTISTNVLPNLFPEIRAAYGWDIEQIARPNSLYFLYIALVAPLTGWLLRRVSPKRLMLAGIWLAFLAECAITWMQSYTHFMLIYVVLSVAITFSGLIPSMVIISHWFQRNRGLAVGVFLLGSSAGGILYVQFAKWLMSETWGLDWRGALRGVALLGLLFSIIPWFFVKDTPSTSMPKSQTETSGVRLIDALQTPTFYLLLLITAAFWYCGFGVLSNLRLYLTEHEFSRDSALNVASIFAVFSMVGKVTFGYISDKFNKYYILMLGTIFLTLGILALKFIDSGLWMAYGYAMAYGFGYSGAFTMIQTTVADVYKGPDFSRVMGLVSSFDSIGGFLGVWSLAYWAKSTGNYDFSINFLLGVCGLTFLLGLWLHSTTKRAIA